MVQCLVSSLFWQLQFPKRINFKAVNKKCIGTLEAETGYLRLHKNELRNTELRNETVTTKKRK